MKNIIITYLFYSLFSYVYSQDGIKSINSYTLLIEPGRYIEISVAFNGSNENEVIVENINTNNRIFSTMNHGNNPLSWKSPINNSTVPIPIQIKSQHKNSGPNPSGAWYSSIGIIISESSKFVILGFEDGVDSNYRDAVVTISYK